MQDEIAALREKVASLEALQEQDVTRIYTDIAQDRKRIAKLENPPAREPSKAMIDRAEKIEKYLASKPDHRATFEAITKICCWNLRGCIKLAQFYNFCIRF